MADVPHFALPFRFEGGKAAETEQDSAQEIADAVYATLATAPGDRDERPEFGVPDQAFGQVPLNAESIAELVNRWEPRARALVEVEPTALDQTEQLISVRLNP